MSLQVVRVGRPGQPPVRTRATHKGKEGLSSDNTTATREVTSHDPHPHVSDGEPNFKWFSIFQVGFKL